jgi:glycine cleavage system regulatory protein
MTVIGEDRPGLVESVASLVTQHGGNWLDSRMSRLGGHFAGILHVHVPARNEAALVQELQRLSAKGLTVVVHTDKTTAAPAPASLATLQLVGQDRPGIVRQIARALALHGVNVEELNTSCESAPMSGDTLFKAEARLAIPAGCDAQALRRELEKIAADLMVDVNLVEAAPSA